MTYRSVVISSGHGKLVRGASGYLDEVDEARKVVEQVAEELRSRGVDVTTFHDDISTTQNENLNRIVDFHNSQQRELDISVHFNAYETTSKPMGTECLYITQESLAAHISGAIASVGFLDRGPKYRDDLFFLNNTAEPAILIETCFVDSSADAELYNASFEQVCAEIANVIGGEAAEEQPPEHPERPPLPDVPRVVIHGDVAGRVAVVINGELLVGTRRTPNVVRLTIASVGEVTVTINGQDLHNKARPDAAI